MTTEPNPAQVSQMAREAAATYWDAAGYPWFYATTKGGEADDTLLVQAFARFEQAIRSTQVGEDRNG